MNTGCRVSSKQSGVMQAPRAVDAGGQNRFKKATPEVPEEDDEEVLACTSRRTAGKRSRLESDEEDSEEEQEEDEEEDEEVRAAAEAAAERAEADAAARKKTEAAREAKVAAEREKAAAQRKADAIKVDSGRMGGANSWPIRISVAPMRPPIIEHLPEHLNPVVVGGGQGYRGTASRGCLQRISPGSGDGGGGCGGGGAGGGDEACHAEAVAHLHQQQGAASYFFAPPRAETASSMVW